MDGRLTVQGNTDVCVSGGCRRAVHQGRIQSVNAASRSRRGIERPTVQRTSMIRSHRQTLQLSAQPHTDISCKVAQLQRQAEPDKALG